MDIIKFFKEESFKELKIKADCNYIVIGKKYGHGWKILPYSIWYCQEAKVYLVVKVNKYGQSQPKVNTVLDSNDHEEYTEAFKTLKSAKKWVYFQIVGEKYES